MRKEINLRLRKKIFPNYLFSTVDFIPIRLELPELEVLEALPYEKPSNNL